jgi:hypothetical protein
MGQGAGVWLVMSPGFLVLSDEFGKNPVYRKASAASITSQVRKTRYEKN